MIFSGLLRGGKRISQENYIAAHVAAGYELEQEWVENGIWHRSYVHPKTKRRVLFVSRKKAAQQQVQGTEGSSGTTL